MDSITILGLRVHRLTMTEALHTLEEFITDPVRPRHIVTADASMAVLARQDPGLLSIVRDADLITPDGAGILWASKLFRTPIPNKVSGVDIVAQVCRLSAEKGYRVFFLGAAPGVAEKAAMNLGREFTGSQIVGVRDGYFKPEQEPEVLAQIKEARPDVLFVGFGIPKQEKWICSHKAYLSVPVSIGIGGSFDVYSGLVKRAPIWMQNHGWEWLYRLWSNPKKIRKVMTLPQFVMMALRKRYLGVS